jgi:uncharacterized membrane protein YfcA
MNEFAAYGASLGIGLSLGLIGAGGSILTIPIFVYILQKDPLSSGIYSMFVVGISGLVGSIQSILNRLVDFKVAFLFGVPSVLGVVAGRKLILPAVPGQLSIGSFVLSKEILFMLCLAILMFFAAAKMVKDGNDHEVNPEKKKPLQFVLLLSLGLLVGIITGIMGIGGGFLVVPALYFWAKLQMKTAIGTTLLIITINSLFSFLASYSSMMVDWALLVKFSLGSILGILIGTKLSTKISGHHLKKTFGWFVLTISFYIIYKQFFL